MNKKTIFLNIFILLSMSFKINSFSLKSESFGRGETIPKEFTCDGENISPHLFWSDVPEGVKSFALICDDPDAPKSKPCVHWIIFNIPIEKNELSQSISREKVFNDGTIQGINDFNRIGYDGPCPPKGNAHRYYFKLYALSKLLDLNPGAKKENLLNAIEGYVVDQAELMGKYQKN